MTWNCTGGVQLTAKDENNQTLTTTYNAQDYWRPNIVTDQLGNQTNIFYQPNATYCCPPAVLKVLTFNNNSSVSSDIQYKDALGRTYTDQHQQYPNSPNLDTVSYGFDAKGRLYSTSGPCSVGATGTCSTPTTTQTYDALNRPLVTRDGGGGTVGYSYPGNDVLVTIGPAPTGENTKRRQLEYDALGRVTSVCEVTNVTGSGICGQNSQQTGFWTKYSYDALGDLTAVTQNAQATSGSQQTRSYVYDAMTRLTSETNPESGTVTYYYDIIPTGCYSAGTHSAGDLTSRLDAAGNRICNEYDARHRLWSVGASTGCRRYWYDSATVNGVVMANTAGRLAETSTDNCGAWPPVKIVDIGYSYTARGEISDVYQSSPHSGGFYHSNVLYWANGATKQLTGPGFPTITYGVDGEGRINTVSASSGQNPVTATTYSPASLPTAMTFGSSDSDSFAYDPNTNRTTQYKFTLNTTSLTGALGWNANGTLQTQNITDGFNAADTQNCSYTYDDVTRLASANCGSAAAQTFTYDPFGNMSKSGSPYSFLATYSSSPPTNRIATIGSFTPSYDSTGNVLNDGLHTYTWDAYQKPITIDGVTLTDDANGRTVEKNVSGTYTETLYAANGAKLALMSGQTLQKAFVPLPSGGLAVYNPSGLFYYGHPDHLGSIRMASTPSRTMYFDTAYAPFGETYASSGTTDPAFTSQRQDTVSNLYDFPSREYGIQGRWPSPDPAGLAAVDPSNPQSWNRYAYVLNNPLSMVDPQGLCGDVSGDGGYDDESSCPEEGFPWNGGGGGVADPSANASASGVGSGPSTGSIDASNSGALNAGAQPNLASMFNEGPGGNDYGGVNTLVAAGCAAENDPSNAGCWGAKLSVSGGTFQGSWSLDGFATDQQKPFEVYARKTFFGGQADTSIGTLLVNGDLLDPNPFQTASLKPSSLPNPTSKTYVCPAIATQIQQLQLQIGNPSAAKQLAILRAMYNKSCP